MRPSVRVDCKGRFLPIEGPYDKRRAIKLTLKAEDRDLTKEVAKKLQCSSTEAARWVHERFLQWYQEDETKAIKWLQEIS